MMDLPVLCIMLMSELWHRQARLYIMPIFTPNDTMLAKHADKGKEDWEIYSWCLRDAVAKAGGFTKVGFYNWKERRDYFAFMNGRLDVFEVQGKSFSYKNIDQSKKSEKVE